MSGRQDHELARSILIGALKFRDALQTTRNPFITEGESRAAIKSLGLESEFDDAVEKAPKFHQIAEEHVFPVRWQSVLESGRELRAWAIEAEAVWYWDRDASGPFQELWDLQSELWMAITRHLEQRRASPGSEMSGEGMAVNRKTVYAIGCPESPDEFARRLEEATNHLQDQVRPMLVKGGRQKKPSA